MRLFDCIKIPGSSFNSSKISYQIRSIHEDAKINMIIAEVYDSTMAQDITKFLNKREQEYLSNVIKRRPNSY